MPTRGAACTSFRSQKRWPQIQRQTVRTPPAIPTRNTFAAKPALPGTSTSTFGSRPWSSSSLCSRSPLDLTLAFKLCFALSLLCHFLDARHCPKVLMGSLVPVLFDRFRAPKAMVQKIHFGVKTCPYVQAFPVFIPNYSLHPHISSPAYQLAFRPSLSGDHFLRAA